MKTNVYVDGFNLYYGSLKGSPYRWLDLRKLCQLLLPKNEMHRIRYFTAPVQNTPSNPDVNLASLLLADGFRKDYEVAVVLSNDSDLCLPIKIVTTELRLPVGLLNPHKRFSVELTKVATFRKQIRKGVLAASQFPQTLQDATGTITKPADW